MSPNPFNPSDRELFMSAYLSGIGLLGQADMERIETILKMLLKDDYEEHYQTARQSIISSHTKQPSGEDNLMSGRMY